MTKKPVDRQQLLDEKRNVSSRITEIVRYIGFGLVIIFYTVMSGTDQFATTIREQSPCLLFVFGIAGVLTIILDYIQFLGGYFSVEAALDSEEQQYDYRSLAYKARKWAFAAKQIVVAMGSAALFVVMVAAVQ